MERRLVITFISLLCVTEMNAQMTECPAGSFLAGTLCQECAVGSYSFMPNSLVCESCSAGTFQNVTGQSSCTLCSPGTSSLVVGANSSSVCKPCKAGTFSSYSSCTICYSGSWSDAGASSCTGCLPGTFSKSYGANSSAACQKCPIGTYSNAYASQCNECYPGTFSNMTGSEDCTPCPAGSFSTIPAANSSSVCQKCPEGMYSKQGNSACAFCYEGTFADKPGTADECSPCPGGTFSPRFGANSSSTCERCPIGSYSYPSSSSCSFCNEGTYQNRTGQGFCYFCPGGTYSDVIGANSSSVCQPCAIGYFAKEGSSSCLTCYAGSYSNRTKARDCIGCPPGTFSTAIAANSSSTCQKCPIGTFAQKPGSSICALCPRGSFAPATGLSSCISCPVGFTTNFTGSNSPGECTPCWGDTTNSGDDDDVSYDDDYTLNSFCVVGSATATPTASGTTSKTASSSRSSSASATISPSASLTMTSSAVPSSTVSTTPSSSSSTSFRPKPPVTMRPTSSAYPSFSSSTAPSISASASASASSSASATASATATVSLIKDNALSRASISPSSSAKHSQPPSQSPSSTASSSITSSQTASSIATMSSTASPSATASTPSCPQGFILTNQSICEACPAGFYLTSNSSSSLSSSEETTNTCTPCPSGYVSEKGQSECKPCNAGSFASGPSTCTPCAAGTYSSYAGYGTNCTLCEVGTYVNTTGATSCIACDPRTLCPAGSAVPGPCLFCGDSSSSTSAVLNSISNVTTTKEATEALLTISAVANFFRLASNASTSNNGTISNSSSADVIAAETAFRSAVIAQLENIVNVIASSSSIPQNISDMNSTQFAILLNDTSIPMTTEVSSALASDLKALTANPKQVTEDSAKSSLNTISTLLALSLPINVQSGAVDAAGGGGGFDASSVNTIPPLPSKTATDFLSAISNVLSSDAVAALSVTNSSSTTSLPNNGIEGGGGGGGEQVVNSNEQQKDREKAAAATEILSQISTALNKLSAAVLRSATVGAAPVSIVSAPVGSVFNSSSSTVQSFCGPALSMTVQRISTAASSVNANNSSSLTSSSSTDETLLSVPLTAPLSPCLATSSLSSSSSLALGSIRRRLSNVVTSVRPSISANGAFLRSATTSSSSSIDVSFVQNGLSPVPQSIGFSSIGGPNTTVVDASSPLDTRVVSVTLLTRSGQKVDVNDAASPLVLQLPLLNPSIQSESSLLVDNYEKRVFNISCPGRLSSPLKTVSATMFMLPTTSTLSGLLTLKQEVALSVISTSASGSSTVSVPCDAPIGNRSFVCSPGDSQSSFSSPYSVTWTCPSLSLVPVCAFWNETLNEWSSAGCVVTQSGGGSISCACNHTTNFAARFTALADQQKVIFTGEKIRENPITLLKQYPYVFILVGGIALFTLLSLLVAYDLDQEAAARYYQSLKNDPEVQFLERIETLKGNVFVLDSVIDKHILLLQDKITRARLEAEASALAKKSGRYYLGHREILPADIFINKTTWSFPVPDGFIFRLRSGHQLCCKKRGRTALSVTTKEGQEELHSLASVDNPLLASSSSSSSKNGTSSVDMGDEGSRINNKPTSPSNAEITIISKNPINNTSSTSTPHESMIQRQLTWLQSLTDKYTSDLYVRFEHVFDRFSITASHEVIELSKKAGLSSAIVDVVKESQQEMASQFPMLSKKNKETSETDSSSLSSPSSIHLDEVKGSIFSRIASLRGFLFRTWFLQVVFTHPLLSLFTKHDPRNPRYFRTIRLAAVMIGSLWTPIFFYGFLHGNTSGTSSTKKESLGQLELLEMIVLAAMSSAVQVPISTALSILLVGAGKAEFNKRYPFIAAELRRRAKVEDELCKMSKPLLEAELRALLQDETDLNAMKKLPNDQGNKLLDDIRNDHNNKDSDGFVEKESADKDSSVIVEKVSVNENNDLISSNSSSIIIDASSSSSSSPPINSAVHSASGKDLSNHGKELFAYGWIDAPPEVQQQCPTLLRLCGRHPSQKAAYVAKALKAEEERHEILKDKLKLKKKVAVMNKANKRSAQAREGQSSFVASNAAVSAIGTALVAGNIDDHNNDQGISSGIHTDNHTDDNENDDDDNDVDNIGGSDSNENTVDDMLDGDINSTDIFTFFMSAITMISSLCCARSTSVVNQSVMSMVSTRDVRAGANTNSASKQRAGGQSAVKVAKNGKQVNGGGVDRDSIASIYKLASEGTSKIRISHSPMTIQTFSALFLFVVIVSFWLFYIAQFGFNNSAETTLSIVFVWLFNQAFSLFIVEPMLTGVNVIVTFVLLPAILPHILWIPSVGSAVAGKVACDLANKDGRSVLSGRMENLTLVRAAGAASMLSPEASVVAYGIGAVLSATMSRIGGESLLQQRNGRASGGRSNDDAFHELTETQRNDLIVRRYVLAQLNAAEKAQRRKNNLAKRLVLTVSASRTLKDRVLGRTLISETKGRQGKSRNTSHPSHSNVVVCDEAGLDQVKVPASICGICGEIERGSNVVDNDYIGDFCRCNSSSNSSTDDNDISGEQGTEEVPVRGQCPVCGEDEKLFEEEEGDFCSCNVEL